jgi:hypothetical protein
VCNNFSLKALLSSPACLLCLRCKGVKIFLCSSSDPSWTSAAKRDGTSAETRTGLSAKRTSRFKTAGGQFSRLLAVEECGSAGSDCIIFSKYDDHNLKMSLQGRRKRVKRSGEREILYNVYKFMKIESEVGTTIPLSKVQKRVTEATRVSRRTLCRY